MAWLVAVALLAVAAVGADVRAGVGSDDGVVGIAYLPGLLNTDRFALLPPPPTAPPTTPGQGTPTSQPTQPTQPPPDPTPLPPDGSAPALYVSPTATGTGDGSFDAPWTLQQALSQPAALDPGDIVWLRGGTYTGTAFSDPSLGRVSFTCGTRGTAEAPIVFRNHRDERVTIDGEGNEVALFVQNCSHTWFWGLEVMSSAPVRTPSRAYIYVTAPDVKFINMILHDLADGIDLWTAATDAGQRRQLFRRSRYSA